MKGNEWAEENRSSSTWTYPGTPMNPETVVRPEEHYYLRRKVKKRYKFHPRWNLISIVMLFLIGGLIYQILVSTATLINYLHHEHEIDVVYKQGMAENDRLLQDKKHLETNDYIGERARKLSMIKEGEKEIFFAEPLQKNESLGAGNKKHNISIDN